MPRADRTLEECDVAIGQCAKLVAMYARTLKAPIAKRQELLRARLVEYSARLQQLSALRQAQEAAAPALPSPAQGARAMCCASFVTNSRWQWRCLVCGRWPM